MTEFTANTKILAAVDSSDESLEIVRYVAESAQPASSEIILYTVTSKVPEVFWDLGKNPHWSSKIEAARKWEKKQLDTAMGFMTRAVSLFKQAGFHPASVTTKISPQLDGLARDIIAEARRKYDVLAIGRGKSGSVEDAVLGSIASKIVSTKTAPAVWLIGRNSHSRNVLVAMDSSANALQGVRQAGGVLNRNTNAITLFHAIRGITVSAADRADIFPDSYLKQLLDDAEREFLPILLKAETLLNEMDISPERIATRIVTGVRSRAAAVIEEARKGDYGTIILGRRGLSEVVDFSMGKVTNKLIQMAKEQTLCIVE